jgi:succinate-semialdehyde dehydrogenase/glutarate-semialdehyde dehydrogenase
MKSINPSTGELIKDCHETSSEASYEIAGRVARAAASWSEEGPDERASALRDLGRVLLGGRNVFADLMAREMGKPVREGISEIDKCASVCDYYAEHGPAFLEPQRIETEASDSYVHFEALGVILAVMPWNFPFWQVFRFAAPAIMAGNGVILKHASNVCGCSVAIEKVFVQAGLPADLFRSVFLGNEDTLALIDSDDIAAVTLTGSPRAGREVAARAGRALKKTVLELGGSDPYVVLSDADLDAATETCVNSRLINTGQSCIAAKRFIVVPELRRQFEESVLRLMGRAKQGDPLDPKTDIGPMARADLRDALHRQVRTSVERGARLLLGGTVPERAGAWYPATVLADVGPGMPAYEEELFGPVAAIVPAKDEQDAIRIANDTSFGLGAAVFTRDRQRGERIAREALRAGSCFVNAQVRSDPRLPFGGIKKSGYGRELGSFGLREFVNIKTVYVA